MLHTAVQPVSDIDVVDATGANPRARGSTPPMITVTVTYALSEAGRKASLLAGGDGRAVQRRQVSVPSNRLHLVRVTGRGVAALALRPRYTLTDNQRIVPIDAPPLYDSPPSVEDLLRDAARNHQLERAYHAERTVARTARTEADRARRAEIAAAFLADPAQRAMRHPSPSPKRCVLVTPHGPMTFDSATDEGVAREVPVEASCRFRADVQAVRERRAAERTDHVRIHEARVAAAADWVFAHGTDEQRARHNAGLLPVAEVLEAIADEVFQPLADRPRYVRDGAARMQAHVRQVTGQTSAIVGPQDITITGHPARTATRHQWALLQTMRAVLPDARMHLHVREVMWRRDSRVPRLTHHTIVVTIKTGPFTLRREYLVPDDEVSPAPLPCEGSTDR